MLMERNHFSTIIRPKLGISARPCSGVQAEAGQSWALWGFN